MDKIFYELIVYQGKQQASSWESETPFGAIQKGDTINLPGRDQSNNIVKEVRHEFNEKKHDDIQFRFRLVHRIVVVTD